MTEVNENLGFIEGMLKTQQPEGLSGASSWHFRKMPAALDMSSIFRKLGVDVDNTGDSGIDA